MIPAAGHRPSAPPTSPRDPDEVALLLSFLHERDHTCPRCGYNLRNLTQPVCPECREDLTLKVGVPPFKLHWLLLTLSPSAFCGIAFGIFVTMSIIFGPPGGIGVEGWLLIAFLAVSGLMGLALVVFYRPFLRQGEGGQIIWATATWAIHLGVFGVVMAYT